MHNDTTLGTALRRWAASSLLSDKDNTPAYYEYNNGTSGDWFTSFISPITYDLGSINLYNYGYKSKSNVKYYYGPYIYYEMPTGYIKAASNLYYCAGESLYGEKTWNIKLKSDVRLTVIARDSLPSQHGYQ